MRNKIAEKTIVRNDEGWPVGVKITFIDGRTVEVSAMDLNEKVIHELTFHGLAQKLGDSYSGKQTVTEAFTECSSVAEALARGEWNRRGGATGGLDLAQAIVNLTGRSMEEVQAMLAEKSKEDLADLKKHKQVKAEMQEIKARRLKEAASEDEGNLEDFF